MAERQNSIALFKNYIDQLDDVYKASSKTAILDSPESIVRLTGAGEFNVPKIDMDGLADYSRKDGYQKGMVTLEFETKKPDYDRGRKFSVDAMDNEESAGVAFGRLASEFIRTKVVPELDAYRFAKLAANAGTVSDTEADTGVKILALLAAAYAAMSELEVPEEGRILFITPTFYSLANSVDTNKDKAILSAFTQVVQVPQTRFYTKIALKDGKTTGEEAGGFAKASDGLNINFLIGHKDAIIQGTKHTVNKIIDPETNQTDDSWLFFYRAYGISDVYDNKKNAIFVHTDKAA